MKPDPLATLQLRQAMYLGFALVQTACPGAAPRFETRFRALLHYFRDPDLNLKPEFHDHEPRYTDLYLNLWHGHPSGRFIPLILDAMFHEFFQLHQRDNPLEVHQLFCEEELGRFVRRYFPDLDQNGAEFRRLQDICRELRSEVAELAEARSYPTPPARTLKKFSPLLGSRSPAYQRVIRTAAKTARSRAPILLTGETGTGKEVLARFIHRQSLRAGGPFVPVHCGAIPETLLESELFGYQKGAFTGAEADKPGQITLAHQGTLFLDEITEMAPQVQVKLLRVLQDHQVRPLGATRPVEVAARVLAATNEAPEAARAAGRLRQDLYYRLNVIRLDLPPLRDRAEDIPALAAHFVKKFNQENQARVEGLSEEALRTLRGHAWPGNVRELENVIHRAVILAGEGRIGPEHLPEELSRPAGGQAVQTPTSPEVDREALTQAVAAALAQPSGARGQPRRLGQDLPLEHIVDFLAQRQRRPFAPQTFADHISPPEWLGRRDKLAQRILRALLQAGVLTHNGRQAQAARYELAPLF